MWGCFGRNRNMGHKTGSSSVLHAAQSTPGAVSSSGVYLFLSQPKPMAIRAVFGRTLTVLVSEVGVVYTALDPKPGLLKVLMRVSGFSTPFGLRAQ